MKYWQKLFNVCALLLVPEISDADQFKSSALKSGSASASAETVGGTPITCDVPGKKIQLSREDWIPMTNQEAYAKNFEARQKSEGEVFPKVVTVFLLEMSSDRLADLGVKISKTEWVRIFHFYPETITVEVSREKGGYWLQSHQVFQLKPIVPQKLETEPRFHLCEGDDFKIKLRMYQREVDRTRFLLDQIF